MQREARKISRAREQKSRPSTRPFIDHPLMGVGFWAAHFTAVKVSGLELLLLILPVRPCLPGRAPRTRARRWQI